MDHTTPSSPLDSLTPAQLREQAEHLFLSACSPLSRSMAFPRSRQGGRPYELAPFQLWMGVVVALLRGIKSQRDIWRLLCCHGFGPFAPVRLCDQAIYNRLAHPDSSMLHALFAHVRQQLRVLLAPYEQTQLAPFAKRVWAFDETTLDKIGRSLKHLRPLPNSDPRLLAGKVAALFDVRMQQWCVVRFSLDTVAHCQAVMWDVLQEIPADTLLLFDLGYFCFQWLDALTDRHIWWVCRLRTNTHWSAAHVFFQQGSTFDGLVWLGAEHSARTGHLVRLVRFRVEDTVYSYLSNVTDPTQLCLADMARLYARRWDIELAFKVLKTHLHMQFVWSAKPIVIQNQILACFLLAQVLHGVHLALSVQLGLKDPFDLSLELLLKEIPFVRSQGLDLLTYLSEQGTRIGVIRPSTRLKIEAPHVPLACLTFAPDDLLRWRTPRYKTYAKRTSEQRKPKGKGKAKDKDQPTDPPPASAQAG